MRTKKPHTNRRKRGNINEKFDYYRKVGEGFQ